MFREIESSPARQVVKIFEGVGEMKKRVILCGMLLLLAGCSSQVFPRPGDTVSPRLAQPVKWTAGKMGELWVDLAATSESGSTRRLGFSASPTENPIASVAFFDAGGALIGEEKVELSQRC